MVLRIEDTGQFLPMHGCEFVPTTACFLSEALFNRKRYCVCGQWWHASWPSIHRGRSSRAYSGGRERGRYLTSSLRAPSGIRGKSPIASRTTGRSSSTSHGGEEGAVNPAPKSSLNPTKRSLLLCWGTPSRSESMRVTVRSYPRLAISLATTPVRSRP